MQKLSSHILVVDDNPGDILLLKQAFGACNGEYEFTILENGEAALEWFGSKETQKTQPDLMMLDINMPGKNGFQILETIRNKSIWDALPILVYSSSLSEEDRKQVYSKRATAFLCKPMGIEALRELARNIEAFWFESVQYPVKKI